MSFVYIASPYSDPERVIRYARYSLVSLCVANLFKQGVTAYSPIAHNHHIATRHDMPTDAAFWLRHNDEMLDAAAELWVCNLEGWEQSEGVRHEIEYAELVSLPIRFVNVKGEVSPYVPPEPF